MTQPRYITLLDTLALFHADQQRTYRKLGNAKTIQDFLFSSALALLNYAISDASEDERCLIFENAEFQDVVKNMTVNEQEDLSESSTISAFRFGTVKSYGILTDFFDNNFAHTYHWQALRDMFFAKDPFTKKQVTRLEGWVSLICAQENQENVKEWISYLEYTYSQTMPTRGTSNLYSSGTERTLVSFVVSASKDIPLDMVVFLFGRMPPLYKSTCNSDRTSTLLAIINQNRTDILEWIAENQKDWLRLPVDSATPKTLLKDKNERRTRFFNFFKPFLFSNEITSQHIEFISRHMYNPKTDLWILQAAQELSNDHQQLESMSGLSDVNGLNFIPNFTYLKTSLERISLLKNHSTIATATKHQSL